MVIDGHEIKHFADLRDADLRGADLQGADLQDAYLDFSCWPLWCGFLGVKVGANQYRQLLYHIASVDCQEMSHISDMIKDEANEWTGIEKHHLEKIE